MTSFVAHARHRYAPFILACATVVALSLVAYAGHVPAFVAAHGIDKVLHAAMSLTLTALLARGLRGRALLAAVVVITPLAIDEYMQRFSASRSSDYGDLVADALGVMIAIAIVRSRPALFDTPPSRRHGTEDLPQ
jgi:VanZ family protein